MKMYGQWVQHGDGPVRTSAFILPRLEALAPDDASATDPLFALPTSPTDQSDEMAVYARVEAASEQAAAQIAALRQEVEYWKNHAHSTEGAARERGYREGVASGEAIGYAAGETRARDESLALLTTLLGLTERCVFATQETIAASHAGLASLAIAIARKIVGEAFALDETLLARRVVALLERLNDVTTATVRLNPRDLAIVQQHWSGLAQAYGWVEAGPRLVGDDAITPGGCVIEAKSHYTDARLETLIEQVCDAFAAVPPPVVVPPSVVVTVAEAGEEAASPAMLSADVPTVSDVPAAPRRKRRKPDEDRTA